MLVIENILSVEQLQVINAAIDQAPQDFKSGALTAGWHAKPVKDNSQAADAFAAPLLEMMKNLVLSHDIVKSYAQPKAIARMILAKYASGQHYGTHIDEAIMAGQRTDLSFTLFLAPPENYQGGELVLEDYAGETPIKLKAGAMVIYPTTKLHRVEAVSSGERRVVVGWITSIVQNQERRDILFDLENLLASLRQGEAPREILDQTLKIRSNLLRQWMRG